MPNDTKTALMDFAERAVRARGFDGFSYADLAEAIGIRKASIHYHFPTKSNLSENLMVRYHEMVERTCARIDVEHATASARLSALIDFYRSALNDGETLCLCVAFIGSRESLSDAMIAKITEFRGMVVGWLVRTFDLGGKDHSIASVADPQHEARAILALLEGAHLAARADQNVVVFDQAMELLKARLKS